MIEPADLIQLKGYEHDEYVSSCGQANHYVRELAEECLKMRAVVSAAQQLDKEIDETDQLTWETKCRFKEALEALNK